MYVRDLSGNEYAAQLTYTWDGELNGNQKLSATILPSKVNRQFINDISEMWVIVDHDGTEYKIIYSKRQGTGELLKVDIRAIPLFFDDFDTQRIYERYDEHMTDTEYFSLVFDGSGYNYVLNGTFYAQDFEGLGDGETRLSMFKKGLERYKAEFRISGNTVYLENQIGRDTQFQYRYKLNASNIVQEIDAAEMYTYARGYGDYEEGGNEDAENNAGLIQEYTSPLANVIGIREAPPIKNGKITTTETMDEQLKTLVDESLKISVSADIHDLRRQGYPLAQPQLGDRTFLIDERIGLNEEVRVVNMSVTKDWRGEVTALNLTFGSQGLSKRYQSNLKASTDSINQLLEGKIKLPYSVLDNAVAEATEALQSAQTELTFSDNGILATDKNDPNNVVLFNSAGLGVSDDGGETFKNAITGNGINANVITAGTMLADRIAGGILQSLNGNTHLDLNTGDWKLDGTADIEYLDARNKMVYQHYDPQDGHNRTAGVGFTESINDRFPVIYLGTTGTGKGSFGARDDNWFNGFIANTSQREATDGIGNSAVGYTFHIRDKAISYNKGFHFDLNGDTVVMRPINAGTYEYHLGASNNHFDQIYAHNVSGNLSSTSTKNAKIGLEDIDGKQAFDYFDMMQIKSFYYKNQDYANPYNRRVSPVVEQLDPVLENLYKTDDESLDINSNLFLLAQAFKYYVDKTDGRLEVLENGTT